jgi:hypothetical protein
MGNELTKKYDKEKFHTASGGHECLWKIYRATVKSTGEPVSAVFQAVVRFHVFHVSSLQL